MNIISIGLYNPIPVQSGVDSYITYLLNPLGKQHKVTHYYFYQSKDKQKQTSKKMTFKTKHIQTNTFNQNTQLPRLYRLLRPDLYINKQALHNINADLVICDTFTFNAAHYIAKKNKCPKVIIKHNIEWQYLKNDNSKLYPLLKGYEHYTNKKSDAIITISMNDYTILSQSINKEKIFYVPHKVNTRIFKPEGPSFDYGNKKLNLLFYGSLDRPMNIEALSFIKKQLIPELKEKDLLKKVRINIFGSGKPPTSLQIEDDNNINYYGLVEDPSYYIRGADIIIVPLNNSGGVKIRLLESLFCGKPIIATSAATDGLTDELKKLIFIKNDATGFTEIINDFLHGNKTNIKKEIVKQLMNQMKGTTMQRVISKHIIQNT